jgi:hypothetical protein
MVEWRPGGATVASSRDLSGGCARPWSGADTINLSWMLDRLCRDGERFERERNEACGERDELRAILAPLLDDPLRHVDGVGWACRFCGEATASDRDLVHGPDCPVPRRDALLGRSS